MTNELDPKFGELITLQFLLANVPANATTDLTLPGGNAGLVVPTGYEFHPTFLQISSNADLTAGTATAKVTADGTELAKGPAPVLSDTVQAASAVVRFGLEPVAAGDVVGVSITTTAAFLPTTADVDAILAGYLVPA
jgi:hypothetical protein